jgi:hypothetical protein
VQRNLTVSRVPSKLRQDNHHGDHPCDSLVWTHKSHSVNDHKLTTMTSATALRMSCCSRQNCAISCLPNAQLENAGVTASCMILGFEMPWGVQQTHSKWELYQELANVAFVALNIYPSNCRFKCFAVCRNHIHPICCMKFFIAPLIAWNSLWMLSC